MKKIIATFIIARFIASFVACGASKRSNGIRKENTSTIMDSGAQSTARAVVDSTKQ